MVKPKKNDGRMARLKALAYKTAAVLLAATIGVILLLRWVPPPTSAFMLRQQLSGHHVDYRWVPLKRISPQAALAVIASEDQNFFEHWGFDMGAIADAIEDNRSRKHPRGASTISQQVAKNLFLCPQRSYLRKGIEAYFTVLMELFWPKKRILEVYLNIAQMGKGVFGVGAAARRYFHRPAARLNRSEAATLAAVLPDPRDRIADRPSSYVIERRGQIIAQMKALGGIGFLRHNGL